jgi:signal transduction histidine kinase
MTQLPSRCHDRAVTPSRAHAWTAAASATVALDLALSTYARLVGATDAAWSHLVVTVLEGACLLGGWLIVRRDPTNPTGPALAWTGAAVSADAVTELLASSSYTGHPLFLSALMRPLWDGLWPLSLVGLFSLLLVFPEGPTPGWRWRLVPWWYGASLAVCLVGNWGGRHDASAPGDPIRGGLSGSMQGISALMIGAAMLLAIASLLTRYRRGGERARLQIRYLLLAGIAVVLMLMTGWALEGTGLPLGVVYGPFIIATVVLVPLAVATAVIRYDLFDVDRLLGETTSWLVTLLLSAAVFGLLVLGMSEALHDLAPVGLAAAAFVVALVLVPLHARIHDWVAQRVDRDRYVAVAAVERFCAEVRAGRREPEEVQAVLQEAQQDPALRVLLAADDGRWVDLAGVRADPGLGHGYTLETAGDAIAHITLGWSSARARRRLADLARATWVPIEISRLRLVLRDALEEARASRARLAEATVAERRRLEHDLHDGAQQRLVATGMRLRLVQRRLQGTAAVEVDAAVEELRQTVEELRRIAHGVRPNRLDDGLDVALAAIREATPLPFELTVSEIPVLDETRTLTTYLVVSEAVANVLKHAHASQVAVRLTGHDDLLRVEIEDDGIGGVPTSARLSALRDRIVSVGGSLTVHSPSGSGTTITALI